MQYDNTPLPSPLETRQVRRSPGGLVHTDTLATEVPVALVFNGVSHAVMMATPQDLEAFALGFALSEGILDRANQCFSIEVQPVKLACNAAVEVQLEIASPCFARLKQRRRSMLGNTGCGVCGLDSLQALDWTAPRIPFQSWAHTLQPTTVLRAMKAMEALQVLNAACGSLHAAAWATPDGDVALVTEDVGRHNALDKLLGTLALTGRLAEQGWVLMSSRASHELVRKCVRLQVPVLATISAPTDLAVAMAQHAGMQLWGLCRAPRAVCYTPVNSTSHA